MAQLKLFMILLGCKPKGRHVEQHDFFFGIAPSLNDLVGEMNAFWPEAEGRIHIDGWREVNTVEGYQVKIVHKNDAATQRKKLFFINLGGYQPNKFEEQHYVLLTAKEDSTSALRDAKSTLFFQNSNSSHVDDKYGIDVDDIYKVEDILSPQFKEKYQIALAPTDNQVEDELHLGYLKMSLLA
jgi:hypothetical protein